MNKENDHIQNAVRGGGVLGNTFKINKVLATIFALTVITIIGTISYAFFTVNAHKMPMEGTLTTGTARVRFADNDIGFNAELNFGESVTKKFTIENTGTVEANVRMYWENLVNTYLTKSLTYTLSYAETEEGPYTEVVSKTNVPRSTTLSTKVLAEHLTIPVGKTYYYNLDITLNYLEDINQESDLSAVFNTSFRVDDISHKDPNSKLLAVSFTYNEKMWAHKSDIKTIIFEDKIAPKENAVYVYDISSGQDGSVMSYLVPDSTDNTKYVAYIQSFEKIVANENSSYLFYGFTSLESIENLSLLDTSNVINMASMFYYCSKLVTVDVSNFDTSNVTNMSGMFTYCGSLTTLDVSNFDTSNVTNMQSMFYYCSKLVTVDVSNFDTSNVTNMYGMFAYCSSLTTLDVSNFDTINVTNMSSMFFSCSNLTTLEVSSFNTSKVTNMYATFYHCSNLTTLDISNFDTINVTDMQLMFAYCINLTILNLSNFNTSNVTTMSEMFSQCYNLSALDISNFDTTNVTDMSDMFKSCWYLTTTITIRGTNCTSYDSMFYEAATSGNITVNYTSDASSLVDDMIATKHDVSNVVKGSVVS